MKKTLSFLLCLVLALGMLTSVSVAEEKRVVTVACRNETCKDELESDLYKELGEELGCEFKVTYYADEEAFATMLASNDLPDIFVPNKMTQIMLESGLLLNLDPYIDEYCPNLKNPSCVNSMELSRQLMSTDGGLYLLPTCIGLHKYELGNVSNLTRGYVLRLDYYKELGCPEIHNDDDYINVMIQMLNNHPINEDGTPNLLYGVERSMSDMGGYHSAFKTSIAVNTWANYQYKNDIFTNEVYDGYLDVEHSRYWDDMAFQNKIYRLGYYDEDSFIMTGSEWSAKCEKGKYMGLYWEDTSLYKAAKEADPDTDTGYFVVPSDGMTNYINCYMVMGQMPNYYCCVSKDTKNIDLVMKLFNYMYDPDYMRYMYCGKQGETWDYDENGVPYMFEQALADRAEVTDYWDKGEGKGGHGGSYYIGGYAASVFCSDGYPIDISLSKADGIAKSDGLHLRIAEAYNVDYWMEAYTAVEKDFRNDIGESVSACINDVDSADVRVIQACDDILTANMATLIMSETEEEFEANKAAVLEELAATGEAEVFERYKAKWDAIVAIMQPLHDAGLATYGLELYSVD